VDGWAVFGSGGWFGGVRLWGDSLDGRLSAFSEDDFLRCLEE